MSKGLPVVRRFVLSIACIAIISPTCMAELNHDLGNWYAVFNQADIGDTKFKWWFDGHARFLDDADGFNQSIVRPGIGRALTKSTTLWGGYGWIHTSPLAGDNFDEHRIWQQITTSKKCDDVTFSLRSRLEQRFVETGDDLGWRFRQFVRLHRPIPGMERLMLVAWDEVFIHLNDTDWGAETGFNQNRAFFGLGWTPPGCRCNWRTEIGYLNQMISNPNGDDRMHHILAINFFVRPR